jgi:hypothetical protein
MIRENVEYWKEKLEQNKIETSYGDGWVEPWSDLAVACDHIQTLLREVDKNEEISKR